MKKTFASAIVLVFIVLSLLSCIEESQEVKQQREKEMNVESLLGKQGVPSIDFSMDRYLLKERIERFNDPNKISYLYVFTPSGPVVSFTIIGKVASTSKRLTNTEEIMDGTTGVLISSHDEMGVWGPSSGDGKVGMTTIGSLIEFGGFGFYIYSEVPISFTGLNQPIIELKLHASETEKKELLNNLNTLKRGGN